MKKTNLWMVAALGLLTACDPSIANIDMPTSDLTDSELSEGFSFKQYEEDYVTESATGNYFEFFTSPSRVVSIYQIADDGSQDVLVSGVANGKFKIVPKRGNPESQTFYVETKNFDGSTVTMSKNVTVYVPTELTAEARLLASDAYGYKVWKWDTDFRGGAVWGNLGYSNGSGDGFVNNGDGIWWGATPEELTEQLQHSNTGVATGEESENAYMEFYDDGKIITYDAGGNQIRSGKFSVNNYTGERNIASVNGDVADWALGTLVTTEGSILFPFQINGGGYMPTEFEIMQLDASHLKLIYAASGTGSWSEATWWAFKSGSDAESALNGFETKAWTWDTEFRDGAVWGNLGYANGSGDGFANNGDGIWWGATPEELTGQLQHSDTGEATGEEDANAYMTFDWQSSTVASYDGSGNKIRSGKFEIQNWGMGERTVASVAGDVSDWALGTLHTDAGSILFPFQINGGGYKPTDFEIMQLDADHLKLIYAADGTGGWSEATWWAFKAK